MLGKFHMKQQLVVLMGPPGSGKGSLSKLLINELGWIQLSTGNLFRFHIANQTSIGKEIDLIISSGKLVRDDIVASMVRQWLSEQDPERTILLDGYPRTVDQAKDLVNVINENSYSIKVFDFGVPDEVIINRLAHRLVCSNKACQSVYSDLAASLQMPVKAGSCDVCSHELMRRADDEPSSVAERLRIYHSHARELEIFFKQAGFGIEAINGNVPLSVVYEEFLRLYNHSYV